LNRKIEEDGFSSEQLSKVEKAIREQFKVGSNPYVIETENECEYIAYPEDIRYREPDIICHPSMDGDVYTEIEEHVGFKDNKLEIDSARVFNLDALLSRVVTEIHAGDVDLLHREAVKPCGANEQCYIFEQELFDLLVEQLANVVKETCGDIPLVSDADCVQESPVYRHHVFVTDLDRSAA